MIAQERIIAARNYVRRIQQPAKKVYAREYLNYLLSVSANKLEPSRGELSFIAAQDVRIELRKLIGREET